ncbi:MAG: rhodanese-related sulfurtransferase [Pseudomonadota bacterium]|nr:rhodanese-related sulfurtransferase [Pseudomonadota bacterium]
MIIYNRMTWTIAALYRFVTIADPAALRLELRESFAQLGLCGTLLVAPEGINGTLAGSPGSVDRMLEILHEKTGLPRDDVKFSAAETKPFRRQKIRLKREIITFGQPQADPAVRAGQYVEAKDWNALVSQPDVLVLDTRNTYETAIGTFRSALDPQIECFTDFVRYVREKLDPQKHRKVAMYCTGGIRCEKASAFMLAEGFPEVYHLKGGILKYLEDVPQTESRWNGECYVFDRRVSVGHGLVPGQHSMCFSCGFPLTPQDRSDPRYEEGVSCPRCAGTRTEHEKANLRTRPQQRGWVRAETVT